MGTDSLNDIKELSLYGYRCSLYLPTSYSSSTKRYPVVYLIGESNILPLTQILEQKEFILLGIETTDWEKDFSPWPAEPLSKKSAAFPGGASCFLTNLSQNIKPYIDSNYRTLTSPKDTTLIGYSLAGLTSLYSIFTTSFADKIASCSGSLWYPGWIDFCESHSKCQIQIKLTLGNILNEELTNVSKSITDNDALFSEELLNNNDKSSSESEETTERNEISTKDTPPTVRKLKIYLSLGDTEKRTKHPLMSKVEDCTQQTVEILKNQFPTSDVFFEFNNGGHFTEPLLRIAKAIHYLQQEQ